MDFLIFNDSKYSIHPMEELNFLKTSLLLGNHVILATPVADFINIYYATDIWTVEQKLKYYQEILKTLQFGSDIQLVMDCFDIYIKLKKIKHKNKQQLVLYQMAMNTIKSTDKFIKAGIDDMLVKYYFDDLKHFLSKDNKSILLHVAGTNNYQFPEQLTRAVELISKSIYVFKSLPVLADLSHLENINIVKTDGINNILFEETNNGVIQLELFKFPRAHSLAASLIKQIRDELSDCASDFFEDQYLFNKINYSNHFNSDTINNIIEFEKNTSDKIKGIQNIIDNNIYLVQSRNNNPALDDVIISLNFTTCGNLVNIYKEFKLITEDAALYIKEMVTKFSDLSALTTFLTFKNINHV